MHKHKNKQGSFPQLKKGSRPLNNDFEETSHAPEVNSGNNNKKNESANLFEDNIRKLKKEGD